ncbi:hypothetical protein CRM22_005059 [Opisthorchis felineus]|uniref:G-protein coupled receptors family 1 profile domain-containing protein n=1 Tax=Opisthorchis felineus TaxID=147828 RepID=A0A4V3SF43_OPIFE|nr:hypothetical protein CRM22_005059 [Opisthorchis felineus]
MLYKNHSSVSGNSAFGNQDGVRKMIGDIGFGISLVLLVIIVTGNVSVLVALLYRNVKNQMRWFIVNLAATDLCVAIAGVLPECILDYTSQFRAPIAICKIVKYMASASTYASSFALIVLSIDRAEAVCRPLRVATSGVSSKTQARLLICGAWFVASLCGLPGLILAQKTGEGTDHEACYLNFRTVDTKVYMTCIAVSVFMIPATIIAICHIIMVTTIWKASKLQPALFDHADKHGRNECEPACRSPDYPPHVKDHGRLRLAIPKYVRHKRSSTDGFLHKPSQTANIAAGCIPRARIKTVKMTFVIVSVYIICWCPFMVWNLLVTFEVLDRKARMLLIYTPLIQKLVPLNSATNPLIFWIFNARSIRGQPPQPRATTQITRSAR